MRRAVCAFVFAAFATGKAVAAPPVPTTPENVAPASSIPRSLVAREIKAAVERERQSREAQDLVAQQQMAVWARAMFWATAAQALFSLLGLIGLGFTVLFAYRTARDGRIASTAAVRAVTTAEDTAKRQLRAYVGVRKATAKFEPNARRVSVEVIIKNAGQTPAQKLVWATRIGVFPLGKPKLAPFPDPSTLPPQEMLPGREVVSNPWVDLRCDEELASLKANKVAAYLAVWCRYVDVYGDEHEHTQIARTVFAEDRISFRADGYETTTRHAQKSDDAEFEGEQEALGIPS